MCWINGRFHSVCHSLPTPSVYLEWQPSGRGLCACVFVCVWTQSDWLTVVVNPVTSPSILCAVSDPVPWLWIMGRERAHPEAVLALFADTS